MFYIRTIFSEKYESKYIKLQLSESEGYADYVIVCEFNYTHTGLKRDYIFSEFLKNGYFSEKEKDRIIYLPIDATEEIFDANDYPEGLSGEQIHANERLFRGAFVKYVKLNKKDIIISVDADEIVFRRCYPELIGKMTKGIMSCILPGSLCYRLKLHQFYYRPDYLWIDARFCSPTICFAIRHRNDYPAQWRDEGKILETECGCHFSWVLTVNDMIRKLSNYAHNDIYGKFADKDVLIDAIKNKKYPFDPDRPFTINVIDSMTDRQYYPDTYKDVKQEFDSLIENQFK